MLEKKYDNKKICIYGNRKIKCRYDMLDDFKETPKKKKTN